MAWDSLGRGTDGAPDHLQAQPAEMWERATDDEIVEALHNLPRFIDPRFMNYCKHDRPAALRRQLIEHQERGGYLGAPARRWLGGG